MVSLPKCIHLSHYDPASLRFPKTKRVDKCSVLHAGAHSFIRHASYREIGLNESLLEENAYLNAVYSYKWKWVILG